MNENQIRSSLQIMDELQQQPIWNVFENIDSKLAADEVNHPYSFDQIYGRLEKKIYHDAHEWINEMRNTFSVYADIFKQDELKRNIINKLWQEFEFSLRRNSIEDSEIISEIKAIKKNLSDWTKNNSAEKISIINDKLEPYSKFYSLELISDINDLQLQRCIRMLRSRNLFIKIAAFIHKLQPEAVIMNEIISIQYDILSPDNLMCVKKFVADLIQDAAKGVIDPFENCEEKNRLFVL
ncbi:hypothetical protein TVAG_009170 [Trichomonas vaginalis G3]|uniref:Bromo domain-containing protein n=1 Tax=Trichomonas vaginalis (strain ATCC PRA-98 / G3) TaxID=412133 RepID=A2G551_TRIV3|nr:bromodomain family [Trichomonas vaginalis G3]EAX87712.1 hypothetical protein TVAG_009170 [Trichomonas vaginalis G3]KAI5554013.1 bromodomain family [Trichomonas vaginalis G3]|eukprot:XP_001300642.1 hypothetical protein [Trichomonas vaginalis G3]